MRLVSPEEFESAGFAATWKRVLGLSPVRDLGQTYEWNRYWWSHYGRDADEAALTVVIDESDGRIAGLWPMFVARRFGVRMVSWIGQQGGFPTDHTAPLVPPGVLEHGLQHLMEFLDARRADWDVAELAWPQEYFPAFARAATVQGSRAGLSWSCDLGETTTVIPLPASFDAWLAGLSSRTRHDVRQMLRNADRHGIGIEIVRGPEAARYLPELFRLNSERWVVFQATKARRCVSDAVTSMSPGDTATFLAALRRGDESLAMVLGYDNGETCFLHSAGVTRRNSAGISAGVVMYTLLVRTMIEAGRRSLDMGPGLEEYKFRLGAVPALSLVVRLWHEDRRLDRWRSRLLVHGAWKRAMRFAAALRARIGDVR